jgi:biotin carboxyl carrier protein
MDGVSRALELLEIPGGFRVLVEGRVYEVTATSDAAEGFESSRVRSPVPGVVAQVHVTPGALVAPGARLVTLLAMKLQHDVTAAAAGTVAAVHAAPGQEVQAGETLVEIAPSPG